MANSEQAPRIDFEQFYTEYFPILLKYVLYRTSSELDAEDIASKSFLATFEALEQIYKGKSKSPSGYLFRTAKNLTSSYYSERKFSQLHDSLRCSSPSPETIVMDKQIAFKVRKTLSHLPALQQTALELKEIDGMSLEEIADVTRTNIGGIKSARSRGREKFKKLYPPERAWQ